MSGSASFSVISTVQEYIQKMISVTGMKALILDEETTLILAMVYGQSEIIAKEVFLVERIDQAGHSQTKYQHLKALVFIRPTEENQAHVRALLQSNKYKEYHLFYSNVTGDEYLRQLAEADERELVRTVSEYYADFYAITDNLWTLNIEQSRSLTKGQAYWLRPEKQRFSRTVGGLAAFFASIKRKPEIRYSAASELNRSIGQELTKVMREQNDLFNYPQSEAPLLLLCDRRDDPVTPLLTQWTYQAMVHQILGIKNNTVDLRHVQGVDKSTQEVVLSVKDDRFYKDSQYLNFGELGSSVKSLVSDYQRKTKSTHKLDTLEDMQRFVDNFPEFKSLAGNVSKHVTLMHVLSDTVKRQQLLRLSELEQDLACSQDHAKAIREIFPILEDNNIAFEDKVRVVALYALRYERENNQLVQLKGVLRSKATSDEQLHLSTVVDEVLRYAGAGVRAGDLFGNKSVLSKMVSSAKSTVRGVDNIYTQHKPLLADTLKQIAENRLAPKTYPFMDASGSRQGGRYRLIVVYFSGGVTYEETAAVAEFNATNQVGLKVVVGGSCVQNSHSFIRDALTGSDQQQQQQEYSNTSNGDFS